MCELTRTNPPGLGFVQAKLNIQHVRVQKHAHMGNIEQVKIFFTVVKLEKTKVFLAQ